MPNVAKTKLAQVKTDEIQAQQAKKEKTRLMVAAAGIVFADMLMFSQIRQPMWKLIMRCPKPL